MPMHIKSKEPDVRGGNPVLNEVGRVGGTPGLGPDDLLAGEEWIGHDAGKKTGVAARSAKSAETKRRRERAQELGNGLVAACSAKGGAAAARFFLSEGADPSFKAKGGSTPLRAALLAGDGESAKMVSDAGGACPEIDGIGFLEAAFVGGDRGCLALASNVCGGDDEAVGRLAGWLSGNCSDDGKHSWRRNHEDPFEIRWGGGLGWQGEQTPFVPDAVAWFFERGGVSWLSGREGSAVMTVALSSVVASGDFKVADDVLSRAKAVFPGYCDSGDAMRLVGRAISRDDAAGVWFLLSRGLLWGAGFVAERMRPDGVGERSHVLWTAAMEGATGCLKLFCSVPALAKGAMLVSPSDRERALAVHAVCTAAGAQALASIGVDFTERVVDERHVRTATGRISTERFELNWLDSRLRANPTKEVFEWIGKRLPWLAQDPSGGFDSAFESYASQGAWAVDEAERWKAVLEKAAVGKVANSTRKARNGAPGATSL